MDSKLIWRQGLLVVIALLLGNAAIAQSGPTNSSPAWNTLVAAAKGEGVLVLAGPPQPPARAALEKFANEFGIKMEYSALRSEFWSRLESERAARMFSWDVFVGGIPGTAYGAMNRGWLEPIRDRIVLPDLLEDGHWIGGFGAGFGDKQGKYIYHFTMDQLPLFAVSRKLIPKSELSSSDQLLDPKWKGKILMMDPRPPSLGALTLGNLRQDLGDVRARRLLKEQDVQITNDLRQASEAVIRGTRPIGLGVPPSVLAPFIAEGLGKDVEFLDSPNTPLSPSQGTIVMIANPPHPNAAKLFLNWVLTQKVQADYNAAALTSSRRSDVPSGYPATAVTAADLKTKRNSSSEEGVQYYYVESAAFGQSILD